MSKCGKCNLERIRKLFEKREAERRAAEARKRAEEAAAKVEKEIVVEPVAAPVKKTRAKKVVQEPVVEEVAVEKTEEAL